MLEQKVIPEFYTRDAQGIPVAWVTRMRESMALLTPRFSTNRVVREYTEQYYLPAAEAYRKRADDKGETGRRLVEWRQELDHKWHTLRFGEVKVETKGNQHLFEVQLYFNELAPDSVRVQLYAVGLAGAEAECVDMERLRELVGAAGGYVYGAAVPAAREAADYTARAVSNHPELAVPLEVPYILWQK